MILIMMDRNNVVCTLINGCDNFIVLLKVFFDSEFSLSGLFHPSTPASLNDRMKKSEKSRPIDRAIDRMNAVERI